MSSFRRILIEKGAPLTSVTNDGELPQDLADEPKMRSLLEVRVHVEANYTVKSYTLSVLK